MIQLTGVASRYVGYYIAGFLILLGLFPSVGLIFSLMPEPVLGGATDVRNSSFSRHSHYRSTEDQPESNISHRT